MGFSRCWNKIFWAFYRFQVASKQFSISCSFAWYVSFYLSEKFTCILVSVGRLPCVIVSLKTCFVWYASEECYFLVYLNELDVVFEFYVFYEVLYSGVPFLAPWNTCHLQLGPLLLFFFFKFNILSCTICLALFAVVNGHVKRPQDEDIQSNVLEIVGSNIQSTYITCPADPSATLGIKLPFLVVIVKNLKKYFTFEIQVLDDKNVRRRFRASNFQVCKFAHVCAVQTFLQIADPSPLLFLCVLVWMSSWRIFW